MVVEDATLDDRFAANPLVTAEDGIRFYAGAPLRTPEGKRIGTLCVIDTKPHPSPTGDERRALERLAERTVTAFSKRTAG